MRKASLPPRTIDGQIIAGLKVSDKLASFDRLDYDVLTACLHR